MNIPEQVVITGTCLVSSLGKNSEGNWDAICSGRSGIRPISGFDTRGFTCRHAAEVGALDPETLGIHPRDARIMDTHAYLLMMASRGAFRNSGLDQAALSSDQIGFYAGMGMVDYRTEDILTAVVKSLGQDGNLSYPAFYTGGYREIYPLWPLSMLNNITFCQVGIDLGIRGENAVFCPHAEAGAQAITEGLRTVSEGRAKAVLVGGVSEKVSPLSIARGQLAGVFKDTSQAGNAGCNPFAKEDKGTLMGEGAGILSLELRSSADSRRAPYSVMISGYGHTCEPLKEGPSPSAAAISCAMGRAIETASLNTADIDLIIAHGDGSAYADQSEAEAINETFGRCRERVHVYSSKAAIGNLFAGAPAADIILGMHMIEKGIIPFVTHDITYAIKDIGLVIGKPLRKTVRRVMVNCQSYEGQAASLIIEAVK